MVVQKLRLTTSYTITPLLVNFFPGIHILTILVALLISLTWLVFWNSGPGFGAHRGGARSASCVSQPLASNSWHELTSMWCLYKTCIRLVYNQHSLRPKHQPPSVRTPTREPATGHPHERTYVCVMLACMCYAGVYVVMLAYN